MSVPDAPTEAESERDGFVSYAGEVHAMSIGLFGGFATAYAGDVELVAAFVAIVFGGQKLGSSHLRDARREAAYTAGFFVASWALVTAVQVLLGG